MVEISQTRRIQIGGETLKGGTHRLEKQAAEQPSLLANQTTQQAHLPISPRKLTVYDSVRSNFWPTLP
ncbi:hypothetical protein VTN31DRAFT_1836 [Thermomyces dupontii]|uniref:uncharacterized protein n=1 Tax=Talaromyces thermophilus TaxID=28565 RepID=UPI003743D2B5